MTYDTRHICLLQASPLPLSNSYTTMFHAKSLKSTSCIHWHISADSIYYWQLTKLHHISTAALPTNTWHFAQLCACSWPVLYDWTVLYVWTTVLYDWTTVLNDWTTVHDWTSPMWLNRPIWLHNSPIWLKSSITDHPYMTEQQSYMAEQSYDWTSPICLNKSYDWTVLYVWTQSYMSEQSCMTEQVLYDWTRVTTQQVSKFCVS
jgi:hypothetical protein